MGKIQRRVVFDVDGTLITTGKKPKGREEVIDLLLSFHMLGWQIFVHSGGGVLYAKRWVQHLNLDEMCPISIAIKGDKKFHYDIAVDDCIDEEEWTKEKQGNYINADYYIKV